jgi:hypothetical protein
MLSGGVRQFLKADSIHLGRAELSVVHHSVRVDELPLEFDSREAWPGCPSISDIYDQSACGDCWAVSVVTTATDRLCISQNGTAPTPQPRLSVEQMLGCCHVCGYGCGDGFPNYAWQWLAGQKGETYGLVTGGEYGDSRWCSAYSLPPCNHYDNPPQSPRERPSLELRAAPTLAPLFTPHLTLPMHPHWRPRTHPISRCPCTHRDWHARAHPISRYPCPPQWPHVRRGRRSRRLRVPSRAMRIQLTPKHSVMISISSRVPTRCQRMRRRSAPTSSSMGRSRPGSMCMQTGPSTQAVSKRGAE